MPSHLEGTSGDSSSLDEATSLDVENQGNPGDQESAPDSSAGADGKETVSEKDWDPLSVVKKAVGQDPESDTEGSDGDQGKRSDKSSKSENDGQKTEDDANEPLGEITDEELKSYKPKTRKRIEGLLDDRQRLTERLEAVSPAAEQMENLQNFMQERGLTPQNVSELMVVGGLAMSDDPKDLRAALTRAKQFVSQIETALGDVMPEDLQKKVDEGLMDVDSAKEVAQARAAQNLANYKTQKVEQRATQTQSQSQQEAQAAQAQVVHTTISDWQRQKFSTDPDYPRKAELLQKEITLRVQAEGGRVLDKNKALKIAEEAYAEVNRLFKSLSPTTTPPAKRMMQSKAAPGNLASRPNSPLEAARQGLAKTK